MLHFQIKKSNLCTRVLQDEYFSFSYIFQEVFTISDVYKAFALCKGADCTPNQMGEFIQCSM